MSNPTPLHPSHKGNSQLQDPLSAQGCFQASESEASAERGSQIVKRRVGGEQATQGELPHPGWGTPSPNMGDTPRLSLTKVIGLRVSVHLPLQALGEGF